MTLAYTAVVALQLIAASPEAEANALVLTVPENPTATERLTTVSVYGTAQYALQYGALYLMEPPNWKSYGNSLEPSWAKFKSNLERAPVYEPKEFGGGGVLGVMQSDGDGWITNVVGHGVQGSEIYLRMRQKGFSWWASALVGGVHSTVWEYGVEGWNETPSGWDLMYTPVGGVALGELRYRLYQRYGDRWYVRALADPVGELVAIFE